MSALIRHIAVVPDTREIPLADVAKVSAAVQKQITRDFTPVWNVSATVNVFSSLEEVPIDYWPVIIRDIPDTARGYHTDRSGQPFAVVDVTNDWPRAVSHECLEILTDPFGNWTVAGAPPPQAQPPLSDLPRVNYLVEICDPCEHPRFGYTVNGIDVSDFVTPDYFSPRSGSCGRFSFQQHVKEPHGVLEGGYVSFGDPVTGHWYQVRVEDGEAQNWDLGSWRPAGKSLREVMDRTSRSIAAKRSAGVLRRGLTEVVRPGVERASLARAQALRELLAEELTEA